ncbi:23S rRNA (adenine(2503)-C(2))-methyltransferase RlmN [Demequina pelophila]|uniref:23S rRNA (adenine(2503)-C(2))-methyltransferase RlmN n=1 Tax=Demequina pelophila TaxID=1638984 RepID=UPI000786075C|nr:23S rRNA (adenine(2503)-C(2))-methyltransferase RlmN [Demequina pelophila]
MTATEHPRLPMLAPRRGKPPRHFADLDAVERKDALKQLGQPGFRAKQLATHYYDHLTVDADDMTDLPAAAREDLVAELFPPLLSPVTQLVTPDGETVKTLFTLVDGAKLECVLMKYPDRATLCVTSQAGCGMACPFCATGQMGLTRNLSAAEIVEQVRLAARAARDGSLGGDPVRLSNVVFMGMGEPLANYNAVMTAVRALTSPAPEGFGLSARHVTVSTVGLVTGIDRLAGEGIPVTLALSLHAPDDELRDEIVPINARWKVDEALDAARRYFDATGRRVSIEYALIRNINDHAHRAELLAKKLRARGDGWVHVNPIPLNPTPGSKWTASDPAVEREFVRILRMHGIPTTIRDTRGSDIDGACGQLAIKER